VTKGGNKVSFNINLIKTLINKRTKRYWDVRLCTPLSVCPI